MNQSTPTTYILLLICLIISVPSAFIPNYYSIFSGELPHQYWWQKMTMAFQHGAVGQPLAILGHLALNMTLLLTCGRMTEQLLGGRRFLVLTIGALVGFILTQWISGIWINGSSGIIWAYSPFLLSIIQNGKRDQQYAIPAQQAKVLLIIMWGVVTVLMGFVPLIFNPNHSLLHTFFFGNLFHASATAVGFVFFFLWKPYI